MTSTEPGPDELRAFARSLFAPDEPSVFERPANPEATPDPEALSEDERWAHELFRRGRTE